MLPRSAVTFPRRPRPRDTATRALARIAAIGEQAAAWIGVTGPASTTSAASGFARDLMRFIP